MTYRVQGADGALYGPSDVPTLQGWAREGRITPETWLSASAESPPFQAGAMPELQAFWPGLPLPGRLCGNCGQSVGVGVPFCPRCGYGSRPMPSEMPPLRLLTGVNLWDYMLGVLPTALLLLGPTAFLFIVPGVIPLSSVFLWLVIGAVPAIAALTMLKPYQAVRRGVKLGLWLGCAAVPLLMILGAVSAVNTFFSTPWKPCNFP